MSVGKRLPDDVEIKTMQSFGWAGGAKPGMYLFIGDEQVTYQGTPITFGEKHIREFIIALAYTFFKNPGEDMKAFLDQHKAKLDEESAE